MAVAGGRSDLLLSSTSSKLRATKVFPLKLSCSVIGAKKYWNGRSLVARDRRFDWLMLIPRGVEKYVEALDSKLLSSENGTWKELTLTSAAPLLNVSA